MNLDLGIRTLGDFDPETKARWVDNLRSGRYNQGHGVLRRDPVEGINNLTEPEFCCLGVLCDTIAPELWTVSERPFHGSEIPVWKGDSYTLPENLATAIGIGMDDLDTLVAMNDGSYLVDDEDEEPPKRHSFAEIANWIEVNL